MRSRTPFTCSDAPFLQSPGVGVSPGATANPRPGWARPRRPPAAGRVRAPRSPRADAPAPRPLATRGPCFRPAHRGAVRRPTLSPRESRLTRLRRCALLAPAVAAAAPGSGGPGGLRLPSQQSLDRGHSPSSSGLVSR